MTQPDLKTRLAAPPSSKEEACAWGDEMLLTSGQYEYRKAKMGNISMWYHHGIGQGPWLGRPNPVTSIDAAMAEIPEGWELVSLGRKLAQGLPLEIVLENRNADIVKGQVNTIPNGVTQSAIARAICITILEIDNATS